METLRKAKRMTQEELEKLSGVSQRMISYYEKNEKRMNIDAAKALADALGCRIEDLYEW